MICNKCGKEIDDGSKFCAECGESMEKETVNNAEEAIVKNEAFAQSITEKSEKTI